MNEFKGWCKIIAKSTRDLIEHTSGELDGKKPKFMAKFFHGDEWLSHVDNGLLSSFN